jgi:hypothetical protein
VQIFSSPAVSVPSHDFAHDFALDRRGVGYQYSNVSIEGFAWILRTHDGGAMKRRGLSTALGMTVVRDQWSAISGQEPAIGIGGS